MVLRSMLSSALMAFCEWPFSRRFYDLLVSFQTSLSTLELKRLLSAGPRWFFGNGNMGFNRCRRRDRRKDQFTASLLQHPFDSRRQVKKLNEIGQPLASRMARLEMHPPRTGRRGPVQPPPQWDVSPTKS
jgi:hypothetical protein